MIPSLLLVACNTAPRDYRDVGVAPGGQYPWGGPTNTACRDRDQLDDEIDGYFYCAAEEAQDIVPIDDPLYERCDDREALAGLHRADFLTMSDGVRARAWAVDALLGRELVHDDWGGEPLLVDF